MTLTKTEKCARLMQLSYKVSGDRVWLQYDTSKREYNPYTNKADLMDVECVFTSFLMNMLPSRIEFWGAIGSQHAETVVYIDDHPDKFTARAHAVMAVVEQIYDRRVTNEA